MGDDWRDPFKSVGTQPGLVHPNARAGGAGPASARSPVFAWDDDAGVPHPSSPAASMFDWVSLPKFDIDDRAYAILDAIEVARKFALDAVKEETGEELREIMEGLVAGLLLAMAVVATTTAIGGVAGAICGVQ
jgi:hypothetical protein